MYAHASVWSKYACFLWTNESHNGRRSIRECSRKQTSGSDNRFDVCMFWKGFHALFFSHVKDQTLLYQVLHLFQVVPIIVNKQQRKQKLKLTYIHVAKTELLKHNDEKRRRRRSYDLKYHVYIRGRRVSHDPIIPDLQQNSMRNSKK